METKRTLSRLGPLTLLTSLVATGNPALATDAAHGKELHDTRCTACHDSGVYTRKDRFIGSREALTGQIRRCEANVSAGWSDQDVDDVVQHLDERYYHFDKAGK